MKDAKAELGQRINPSKRRALRVFLFTCVPFFVLLRVFVS